MASDQNDFVKELSSKGFMVGSEAVDDLNEKNVSRLKELSDKGLPTMFVSEDVAEDIEENKEFASALNKTRSDRARSVDKQKKADTVFEGEVTDEELDTWRDNKNEFDISGVDW